MCCPTVSAISILFVAASLSLCVLQSYYLVAEVPAAKVNYYFSMQSPCRNVSCAINATDPSPTQCVLSSYVEKLEAEREQKCAEATSRKARRRHCGTSDFCTRPRGCSQTLDLFVGLPIIYGFDALTQMIPLCLIKTWRAHYIEHDNYKSTVSTLWCLGFFPIIIIIIPLYIVAAAFLATNRGINAAGVEYEQCSDFIEQMAPHSYAVFYAGFAYFMTRIAITLFCKACVSKHCRLAWYYFDNDLLYDAKNCRIWCCTNQFMTSISNAIIRISRAVAALFSASVNVIKQIFRRRQEPPPEQHIIYA